MGALVGSGRTPLEKQATEARKEKPGRPKGVELEKPGFVRGTDVDRLSGRCPQVAGAPTSAVREGVGPPPSCRPAGPASPAPSQAGPTSRTRHVTLRPLRSHDLTQALQCSSALA